MERTQIRAVAAQVEERLAALAGHYRPAGEGDGVAAQLRKTVARAREWRSASFIVLVVGPVKSGKSTLVNLMARAYVSPTHFLECTVRPSIISAVGEGEAPTLTVYHSAGRENSVAEMDEVIDGLRLGGTGANGGTVYPLTRENIERYVELNLDKAAEDSTLATSIRTPGGALLRENVFVVDMPGFDGAYANIDDPVYDAIAQRADLIVFVQSSNSAISKVSTDFLSLLKRNNQDVPVCLVHNVFEAAYWRADAQKRADIEDQKQKAVDFMRHRGFNVTAEYAFSINLGMVADYREANYVEHEAQLRQEEEAYAAVEQSLYDLVIRQREGIRIRNCIHRTHQQKDILAAMADEALAAVGERIARYQDIGQRFDALRRDSIVLQARRGLDVEGLTLRLQNIYETRGHAFPSDTKYTTDEARQKMEAFVADCQREMQQAVDECLGRTSLLTDDPEVLHWNAAIQRTASDCGLGVAAQTVVALPAATYEVRLSLPTLLQDLIPRSFWKDSMFRMSRHSGEKMRAYLRHIYEEMVTRVKPSGQRVAGYVETVLAPEVDRLLADRRDEAARAIVEAFNAAIERHKQAALEAEAVSIDSLTARRDTLDALLSGLRTLHIPAV